MSTKKNHEVYLDYPNNGVMRPYIEKVQTFFWKEKNN